jgi:hypothetical protein
LSFGFELGEVLCFDECNDWLWVLYKYPWRSPHTCLFIYFQMSPGMPLLEFMPRQSGSEDVVLIGTNSVTRYAKKEMLAFWNGVLSSELYRHITFTCVLFVL